MMATRFLMRWLSSFVMTRSWAFSSLAATLPASATGLKEGHEQLLVSFASLIGISPLLQWRGAVRWSRNASHSTDADMDLTRSQDLLGAGAHAVVRLHPD